MTTNQSEMTGHNEQRREQRVAFSGFVRLRGLGEEESVEAEIRNLSALGMRVASKRVPRAGASVFCRVVLGNDRRIIKGKVAWVAPGAAREQVGAGIEFVDLSTKDTEVLRQALSGSVEINSAAGPIVQPATRAHSDSFSRVNVEFEGLPSSIKAQARMTEDGIVLTTKLPFLRVGSNATVQFPGSECAEGPNVQPGRLKAVSLAPPGPDGIPRLLVELATDAPAKLPEPPSQGVAPWPPLARKTEAGVGPAPPVHSEPGTTQPHAPTLPLPSFGFGPAQTAVRKGLSPSETTPVVQGLAVPSDARRVTPTDDFGEDPTHASAPLEITEMGFDVALESVPRQREASPVPRIRNVESATDGNSRAHELSFPLSDAHVLRPHGLPWKLLLGSAVAALALLLVVLRLSDSGPDSPQEASAAVAPSLPPAPPAPTQMGIVPLPALPDRAQQPATVAAPKPAVKVTTSALDEDEWRPISDPSWPFTVAAEGQQTTVFIPVSVNPEGHRIYEVTQPPGVGAIFPHADPPPREGKFTVNEAGVTQVWVETRDERLLLRVLFGRNVTGHTATLEPGGLRVVVKRE